jgi:putative selenate reductase
LGFDVEVPDIAFEHDLKYAAGLALIKSLRSSARKAGVEFNLKLTNTLETTNRDQNLPENEQMVYMSGRALHPISIELARRLQNEFNGQLDISFCAGTDCFNVADILACNMRPVTVCSDILKPGGYGRLGQYLEEIANRFAEAGADSIAMFITTRAQTKDVARAGLENLQTYAAAVVADKIYQKSNFPYESIKTPRELTAFDCVKAPCVSTCPASQDIPGYMYYTARGNYQKAMDVILETNPFPNMQGMVCDHLCQYKCTRMNYDSPLLIREIKRFGHPCLKISTHAERFSFSFCNPYHTGCSINASYAARVSKTLGNEESETARTATDIEDTHAFCRAKHPDPYQLQPFVH